MKKQKLLQKWKKLNKRDFILVLCFSLVLAGLSFGAWGKEEEKYSYSERRVLAGKPEGSAKNILNGSFMEEFEEYSLDQFPFRDRFRSLKALVSLGVFRNKDNNGIYYTKGHLSKIEYPLNEEMLVYAGNKLQWIYDTYLKEQGSKCYFSIIPDKNFYLAEENGYLTMNYQKLFSSMREKTKFAHYLDIIPFLELEDYYKTDTHWRQEKITDVAEFLKAEMTGENTAAVYETKEAEQNFYGVYYGQSALPVKPEKLYYLTNEVLENCIVTSYDTGKAQNALLYNMEKAKGKDAYEMFLEGANALLTIENPFATEKRELLVFRDSFGSSLIPLLVDNYSKITVVDLRYVQSAMLGKLIDFHGQDTLFIYSTLILNQSMSLK